MTGPVITASRLVRLAAGRAIVDDVSLELGAGEAVALLGPSGCGKTTLLQLLGLLDRPDAGRVSLDGEDVWSLRESARAELRLRRLGFVFQTGNLLGHLSARENVALPAWRLGGSQRRALAAADALLERFELRARAGDRAEQLSPGEAQRVAVARALVNAPGIVLADEPTGSLHSSASEALLAVLRSLAEDRVALLVVTHDAHVAAALGRTLRMQDGRLVEHLPVG